MTNVTWLLKSLLPAMAMALSIAWAPSVLAQNAGPGTAGAANAGAASDSVGGGGVPSTTGTAPGSTSPGGINSAPQPGSPPPSADPNQVPSTGGAASQSTTPPSGTVGFAGSKIPGHTGLISQVPTETSPAVEDSEKEVSRRIKNICRGC